MIRHIARLGFRRPVASSGYQLLLRYPHKVAGNLAEKRGLGIDVHAGL
jgi:hypothetical protein